MAWEFLRPVLTANALATVQANPVLLAYFLSWLFVIILIISLSFYISWVTGKPYRKPKKPDAKKSGGLMSGKLPFMNMLKRKWRRDVVLGMVISEPVEEGILEKNGC